MPDRVRLGRTLGWLAVTTGVVGLALLPVVDTRVPGVLPWVPLLAALVVGLVLVMVPVTLIDTLPALVLSGSALANQTAFVLATGDADSPFLAGFTAIVLATAAGSRSRHTIATVLLAATGLLAIALTDSVLTPSELVRVVVEGIVLLGAAGVVAHLSWRRRLELARASHRLGQARAAGREYRLASETDALTGVGNRRAFEAALAEQTQTGKLDEIALLVADADGLKSINDNLGHPAGDALLRAIASTLVRRLRPQDRVYRIGGDEFAAIVGRSEVDDISRRLGGTLAVEVDGIGRGSASIGAATAVPGSGPAELMRLADRQMYRSKSSAPEAGSRP